MELINANGRDLAWRLFVSEKIIHNDPDKIWKTVDSKKRRFKSYPAPKAIEENSTNQVDADKTTAQP